jgi:hypothetical protein
MNASRSADQVASVEAAAYTVPNPSTREKDAERYRVAAV